MDTLLTLQLILIVLVWTFAGVMALLIRREDKRARDRARSR